MNILPKSLNFKTWLYHSVVGICFFLTDSDRITKAPAHLTTQPRISFTPDCSLGSYLTHPRATDPCSFLSVDLADCNPYPQDYVLAKPQLFPESRKVPDVCDWGDPAPWLAAGMGPGYQASALPSWGSSASLWSCPPMRCHENSNAKTFQRRLGTVIFHNKQTKYLTITWLKHKFTCYKFTCHNLTSFYKPVSCKKQKK